MPKQTISIIGTGALGSALTQVLHLKEWPIKSVYNRHKQPALKLCAKVDAKYAGTFPKQESELGKLIFLTVPDQQINTIAAALAKLDDDFSDHIVAHCSGTKTSACLKPLQHKGASAASFHPIQSFTVHSPPAAFADIYIDMEGDETALKSLKKICDDLNSRALPVDPKAKPYIHAASVVASNYMIALMDAAARIAEKGGLHRDEALNALMPLVRQSVENISSSDTLMDALSGPVKRGDTETVARHLELLKTAPDLQNLYQTLGKILVDAAKNGSAITESEAEALYHHLMKRDDNEQ